MTENDLLKLSALWDAYDDIGDITHRDLVTEIDRITNELDDDKVASMLDDAVNKYNNELRFNEKLGGRGCMDSAEEEFNAVLKNALKIT